MRELSAGGIVYRQRPSDDSIDILLIQDRYGKMTLPKGKREAGETEEENALREVWEETGIKGKIVQKLHTSYYQYEHPQHGMIDKSVDYFLIEAIEGNLQAQLEEIRGVEWYSPEKAYQIQSELGYENNQKVFDKAYDLLQLSKEIK